MAFGFRRKPIRLSRYVPFTLVPTQYGWKRVQSYAPGTLILLADRLYYVGKHAELRWVAGSRT